MNLIVSLAPQLAVFARFAMLIDALCEATAAQHAGGRFAPRTRPLAGPVILVIWKRLRRIGLQFARLAERFRTGTLPTRRRSARPSAAPRSAKPDPAGEGVVTANRLAPNALRVFGWLLRLVPTSACYCDELAKLLSEPEMVALRAAAPQAGRLLRPLCRMLGVPCPPDPPMIPTPDCAVACRPSDDWASSDGASSDPSTPEPLSADGLAPTPCASGSPETRMPTGAVSADGPAYARAATFAEGGGHVARRIFSR